MIPRNKGKGIYYRLSTKATKRALIAIAGVLTWRIVRAPEWKGPLPALAAPMGTAGPELVGRGAGATEEEATPPMAALLLTQEESPFSTVIVGLKASSPLLSSTDTTNWVPFLRVTFHEICVELWSPRSARASPHKSLGLRRRTL